MTIKQQFKWIFSKYSLLFKGCRYKKSGQELIGFDGTWEAKRQTENSDLIKSDRVEESKIREKPKGRSEKFKPMKHFRKFFHFSASA